MIHQPLLGLSQINVRKLNDEFEFPHKFNSNFNLNWVRPINESREMVISWFDEQYKIIEQGQNNLHFDPRFAPHLSSIPLWDKNKWGSWEKIKMPILRDCIKVEYPNEITPFYLFYGNAVKKIINKYPNQNEDHILSISNYLHNFSPEYKPLKDQITLDFIQSYFKLSYFGFLKEHRVKLLLATHTACVNREIDVFQVDEKGDLYDKIDFFIYRERQDGNTRGFWRAIGVGSKAVKNKTLQQVHLMIRNYNHSSCQKAGSGLYLIKEDIFDNKIDEFCLTSD